MAGQNTNNQENPGNRHKNGMPRFIETMYGVILGASFYQILQEHTGKLVPICHLPIRFHLSESLFRLLLFCFTLLISAHDWFSSNQERQTDVNATDFWIFIPQLFALFFVYQMIVAAKYGNLQCWFLFAIFYTICNIYTGVLRKKKNEGPTVMKSIRPVLTDNSNRYIIHIILSVGGYIITTFTKELCYSYIVMIITAIVVIWHWNVESSKQK